MVDTGAGISIVDLDFAPGLGLQQNGEHEISGTPTTGAHPALRTDLRIPLAAHGGACTNVPQAPRYDLRRVRTRIPRVPAPSKRTPRSSNMETTIHVHTGGACHGDPGPGGFAAIIDLGDSLTTISGNEPRTTSGRMDLMAAPRGLEAVELLTGTDDRRKRTNLYTRSESLLHFFNQGRAGLPESHGRPSGRRTRTSGGTWTRRLRAGR